MLKKHRSERQIAPQDHLRALASPATGEIRREGLSHSGFQGSDVSPEGQTQSAAGELPHRPVSKGESHAA